MCEGKIENKGRLLQENHKQDRNEKQEMYTPKRFLESFTSKKNYMIQKHEKNKFLLYIRVNCNKTTQRRLCSWCWTYA